MLWTDWISDDCTGCKWVNYSDNGGWYMKSRSKNCPVHGSGTNEERLTSEHPETPVEGVARHQPGRHER